MVDPDVLEKLGKLKLKFESTPHAPGEISPAWRKILEEFELWGEDSEGTGGSQDTETD